MTEPARQGLTRIKDLLARHEVRPRKSLGQNFLIDPNIVDRIVRTAEVGAGDRVVEVGAGTGTLTAAVAGSGAFVRTYESDERLRPILDETVGGLDNVEVCFEDALAADLESDLSPGPWVLVANLPYNIGARLLIDVLRDVPAIERAVVMLQREVATRLVSPPGANTYGLSTVSVALRAKVTRAFNVPPAVFLPKPEVESSVIVIQRIPPSPLADGADVIAAAAFNQRRKMLRRSLTSVLADPVTVIEAAGLNPESRAEDLSAADFLRIAAAVN